MNFDTNLLSRFAGVPELTVRVGFEVKGPANEVGEKVDEVRDGLKDLGPDLGAIGN
ncbi:MAG: hypothetical protein K2X87_22810 [Gemmataceae bacterium]|nr:hypothetical protein [Gemmataceae bacterium]